MPRLGQVVRSVAGRDRGSFYLVVRVSDSRFVSVADGRARTASNPKQKNVRHLDFLPGVSASLAQRMEGGEQVEDREIRLALQELAAESAASLAHEDEQGGSAPGDQG